MSYLKSGIAIAIGLFIFASSAQSMPLAPLHPDEITTQVAYGCGPGRTRIRGVCVARTTIRHTRRAVRRGARYY